MGGGEWIATKFAQPIKAPGEQLGGVPNRTRFLNEAARNVPRNHPIQIARLSGEFEKYALTGAGPELSS